MGDRADSPHMRKSALILTLLGLALALLCYAAIEHVQRPYRLARLWDIQRETAGMVTDEAKQRDASLAKRSKDIESSQIRLIRLAGVLSVVFEVGAIVGAVACTAIVLRIRRQRIAAS